MKIIDLLIITCCFYLTSHAQNVGIDNPTPTQKLDVNGKIKINDDSAIPEAGTMRWNAATKDFEGFDGNNWISFSRKNWGNEEKVFAPDGGWNDYLGISVSISDEYAVVGAPTDDIGSNTDQGSAYIFRKDGTSWQLQTKLTAVDGAAGDYFGYSVYISAGTVVVGARFADVGSNANQGAVYVFSGSGTTWTQQSKLTAAEGVADAQLGFSVSINFDYIITGAFNDDGGKGASYVFFKNGSTWEQQAKLTASDGIAGDQFGYSVDVDGNYAIVGAHLHNYTGGGAAYIFIRSGNTWTQQAKITPADGLLGDQFGWSVSISGDYVIVGAPFDDMGINTDQGSAYIFFRNGTIWNQQAKLTAADGGYADWFGYVSINGNYAAVGAPFDDIGSNENQGSVYLFTRSNNVWTQQFKLTASDGSGGDGFGIGVCISSDNLIAGSPYDDFSNGNEGSVYFFSNN